MDENFDRSKSFTRRAFVVGAVQGAVLAVLGGRLAWLQIVEGQKYKTLADRNRINVKMTVPSRGEVVDRFGVPLALNNQNFRVLMIPEQSEDLEKALKELSNYIELDQNAIDKVLKRAKRAASFAPVEVTDNLSWEDVAKVEVNLPDLPGMSIDVGEIRTYPLAEATAHIVGYVGAVTQSDLESSDQQVLKLPDFRIGKTGIERSYDEAIRGREGTAHMEVNVRGREVRELQKNESLSGKRLVLSIDAELQRFVQTRLGYERSASAVIMDAHTGAVYALSSFPSFDPNLFVKGIDQGRYQELSNNPAFPFNNKAISGQYPPGSTFKMITALAALESGVAKERTVVHCPGHFEYGTDKFHCWKRNGHGNVDIVEALMKSCDTYFYKLSLDIGIDRIAKTARRFGLGQTYNFDLPEERDGLIPDKDWKMAKLGQSWQPGETIVASIGQSYTQTTPLQLAVMTSRFVNGGFAVEPWLVGYEGSKLLHNKQWPSMNVNTEYLRLIKDGMDKVVDDKDGTAYASQMREPEWRFGGKTGTAQVKRISARERALNIRAGDDEWKYRHHALFVGYAPIDNPRYVCSVVIEHGGSGSGAAAPLARDLLRFTQERDPAKTEMKV
ncbi:MAG: penicillin-binding protein 2 [Alphaproteobacteria bacterium]|nr:penicillin-binding protein 2 [Alphaproteobacteria bacterium]NCQ87486.1 penicillin-binding protein 2 [Alphaproteobacteria bacterium]NCT06357.1 penicillin-binding protein 2 [Alphaproteobacteria bacterium]